MTAANEHHGWVFVGGYVDIFVDDSVAGLTPSTKLVSLRTLILLF